MDETRKRIAVLVVRDLTIEVVTSRGWTPAVTSVSFTVARGEMIGLIGESGSGKSLTGLAIMGLLDHTSRRAAGAIDVAGRRVAGPGVFEERHGRRRGLAMVFQNPMTSLTPGIRIGSQIAEAIKLHQPGTSARSAWRQAVDLLGLVEIHDPKASAQQYPHQFSGGMQQRAVIAIAIACQPLLLIADEPTTALDVTVQKGVMDLLARLRNDLGLAILLISHNLALVSGRCERVLVMYAGELIEEGPATEVLTRPRHPYVDGLIRSTPARALALGALTPMEGRVPSPGHQFLGCRFAPRCKYVIDRCINEHPSEQLLGSSRWARCLRAEELVLTQEAVTNNVRKEQHLNGYTDGGEERT